MAGQVSLFGIRHHGPGSARRLVEALDALKPVAVLIEGPADASELLPMLADPDMVTPVALLTYAEDDPANASFFPFADYSPEYQAARWAVQPRRRLALHRLCRHRTGWAPPPATSRRRSRRGRTPIRSAAIRSARSRPPPAMTTANPGGPTSSRRIPQRGPMFAAVADAMTALRAAKDRYRPREAAREAHMRIEIAKAAKECDGAVAVVCGAWHVPALAERRSLAADRELLKGRPKTEDQGDLGTMDRAAAVARERLWRGRGRAGLVRACLWRRARRAIAPRSGLPRRRRVLRRSRPFRLDRLGDRSAAAGHGARGAARPPLARLRRSCARRRSPASCNGERAMWNDVSAELLIGAGVGAIQPATPLAPLLEDLQRQQKATRLKPEALERPLTLDLRSESGLMRSTLLHRLNALDVPWGRLMDAGRSRGTFRENWQLRWEPEFAVTARRESALWLDHRRSRRRTPDRGDGQGSRARPARRASVRNAMIADLSARHRVRHRGAGDQGGTHQRRPPRLGALPPMADILRYGEARTGTVEHLAALMPRIVVQAALALPYAARNLDGPAAAKLRGALSRRRRRESSSPSSRPTSSPAGATRWARC